MLPFHSHSAPGVRSATEHAPTAFDPSDGNPASLVDKQFEKALKIPRSELLSKKVKANKEGFPLVLDYNPILPDIQNIIKKHIHLLRSSTQITEIVPAKSVFPAYRRTKSDLKEVLAPSKFRPSSVTNQAVNETTIGGS